ncbi:SHOCT-like domain-containing protein [Meiothermus granaticius]|uniref:YvlB/LiaX N-terminal domain-containing protein n=1 Tax=Meiothermus granaticius NBRC 107808 TaxID=1227551 RepID=A0A399F887_9DEIN|nr:hypothetical protein [Meiothermus granaticius]RIH92330.1 hypothetical protein Mgrana_01761 [Meiothermus granaticius NBRC 107808]GEM87126.1 hypothetical protein MGR01S_17510 [Meiothermus granaticius NBRC 107808]
MEDKKRIMDMVKEGRISVEEALRLIEAMDRPQPKPTQSPAYAYNQAVATAPAKGIAKMIRIVVDGQDIKVKVNVPASLAKFAANFIPVDAQNQLTAQGIDLAGILDMLKGELPEGRLVDVEINDIAKMGDTSGKMSGPMKVLIEVV